jgi:hypothetical protein
VLMRDRRRRQSPDGKPTIKRNDGNQGVRALHWNDGVAVIRGIYQPGQAVVQNARSRRVLLACAANVVERILAENGGFS